ncbi:MAG: hypothetical protein KGH69_02225 [Candidatus Micrarchaeota archaeon]|nr:hypothetical protein [Candidatus Micrarchaeota archaeon]
MAPEATKAARATIPTKEFEATVAGLSSGELKLREVASALGIREKLAAEIRRAYISRKYGVDLSILNRLDNAKVMDYDAAERKNTSQIIGSTGSLPIGIIEMPPGLISGGYTDITEGRPMFTVTTEKGVLETTQRGLSVLIAANNASANGGAVEVLHTGDGMTRSVTLSTGSQSDVRKIVEFVRGKAGFGYLKSAFEQGKSHTKLKEIMVIPQDTDITLRYVAETGAAMGMNGTTTGANEATRALIGILTASNEAYGLEAQKLGINARITGADIIAQSGNLCTDKKVSGINMLLGRGVSMNIGVTIPEELVVSRLKTTPAKLHDINYKKNYRNASLGGVVGNNSAVANIAAALYTAYGQDIAQITGTTQTMDDTEVTADGSLRFSLIIPVLEVATIGGGTSVELPKALLKASGLYGVGDDTGITRLKLAEAFATMFLAYELSTLAAQRSGDLTGIHEQARLAGSESAAREAKRE